MCENKSIAPAITSLLLFMVLFVNYRMRGIFRHAVTRWFDMFTFETFSFSCMPQCKCDWVNRGEN